MPKLANALLAFLLVMSGSVKAVSTQDCTGLGVEPTTWNLIALGDINFPVPAPYDLAGKQCLQADFNGDGQDDLLVQGASATDETAIFYANAQNKYRQIDQHIKNNELGLDWSSVKAAISAEDKNGDGKADIVITANSATGLNAVLHANSKGAFTEIYQSWANTKVAKAAATPLQPAGSLSITPSGAATYNIPIEVPPGINGMQPQLGFVYNSGAGNGLMGVGWSLAGLSSITRCNKTLAQEGEIGGVEFDSTDSYCADGQKLMAITGQLNKYALEIDNFSTYAALQVNVEGPGSFSLTSKDGRLTHYYGTSENSKSVPAGKSTAVTWLLSRVEDIHGNYIEFEYDTLLPSQPIKEIRYTGNGAQAPTRKVKFFYRPRNDVIDQYYAGHKVTIDKLLERVETHVDAERVNTYEVIYGEESSRTKRSLVSAIQTCGTTQCAKEIGFEWSDKGRVNNIFASSDIKKSDMAWVDFNGDGIEDLCYSTGHWANDAAQKIACEIRDLSGSLVETKSIAVADFYRGDWIDINYDGKIDFCTVRQVYGPVDASCYESDGQSFTKQDKTQIDPENVTIFTEEVVTQEHRHFCDWEVFGIEYCRDIGPEDPPGSDMYLHEHKSYIKHPLINYSDANGDGLLDICYYKDKVTCSINTGSSFSETTTSVANIQKAYLPFAELDNEEGIVAWVDVNGDSIADQCALTKKDNTGSMNSQALQCIAQLGMSGERVIRSAHVGWGKRTGRQWVDVNGDGLSDFCRVSSSVSGEAEHALATITCTISTGTGFGNTFAVSGQNIGKSDTRKWIDVNGDGNADFCRKLKADKTLDAFHTCTLSKGAEFGEDIQITDRTLDYSDRIVKITKNHGVVSKISYDTLFNPDIYVNSSLLNDTASPRTVKDVVGPMLVVSSVESSNGICGGETPECVSSTSYQYWGGRISRTRGFLGFYKNIQTSEFGNKTETI